MTGMTQPLALDADLLRALKRVVGSYESPGPRRDDLAQEVALAVHLALPRFRGDASLRTYALRVAHNVCLRHVTRQRARDARSGGDVPLEDPSPGVDEQLDGRRSKERLLSAVRQLPIAQRQDITLALESLTGAEIAQVLGISDNAVHIRLHRARKRLQTLLESP